MTKTNTDNIEPRGLLKLSAELRNKIYFYCILSGEYITLELRHESVFFHRRDPEPALARTCRRVRSETLPIFYGQNIFFTAGVEDASSLRQSLGLLRTKMLRHVYLDLPTGLTLDEIKQFMREFARVSELNDHVGKAHFKVNSALHMTKFDDWVSLPEFEDFMANTLNYEQVCAQMRGT